VPEASPEGLSDERKSKPIIDAIDRALARYYGFTDEELDFIPSMGLRTGINYEIKYRPGQDGAGDGDNE